MTDEYEIDSETIAEKDGSGDLVIKNIDEATIDRLAAALNVDGNNLTDSGTTVYNASSKTVGDGTTSAKHATVNTENLSGSYPTRVRGIGPGGVVASVDAADTNTPVQDAADAVASAGGGVVYLPPGETQEEGPFVQPSNVSIVGLGGNQGYNGGVLPASYISITNDDTADGIKLNNGPQGIVWRNFGLSGTGPTGTDTTAIINDSGGGPFNFTVDGVRIGRWKGRGIAIENGPMFQTRIGKLGFANIDAGATNGLIDIAELGPDNKIDEIVAYPMDDESGQDTTIINIQTGAAGMLDVAYLNLGGALAEIVKTGTVFSELRVGGANYEPSISNGNKGFLFDTKIRNSFELGTIGVNDNDNVVDVSNFVARSTVTEGKYRITEPIYRNGASFGNSAHIRMFSDVTVPGRFIYDGPVSHIANQTGSLLTEPVVALGDVTKKVSTGAGYDGGTDDSQL